MKDKEFVFRLDDETRIMLDNLAKQNDLSRSSMLVLLIKSTARQSGNPTVLFQLRKSVMCEKCGHVYLVDFVATHSG